MLNRAAPPVLPTGVQVIDKILSGGLAYGGLNVIVGGSGVGKSCLSYNAAANILKAGKKVLVLNTEMKAIEPLLHFMSAYYNTPFYDLYSSCGSTKEEVQQWVDVVIKPKAEAMLKEDNLTFFDGIETTPWTDAFNSIKAHVEADGVSLIVLDNLTGLSESTSSKKQLLDTVLKDLNSLCRQYEVTGLILSHLTKNGGGVTGKDGSKGITFETGAEVGLDNIADSSHTAKYGSNILSYERDINDDSGSFKIRLLKSRYKGTGKVEKGVYNSKTCTFTDVMFSLTDIPIDDDKDNLFDTF
jgi:RecA/RadA recombinase